MKMKVKIRVEKLPEPTYEEMEIEFPHFIEDMKCTRSFELADGKESTSTHYEITKVVSPTESFAIEKITDKQLDGELWTRFESFKRIFPEPQTIKGHYFRYEKMTTEEKWNELHDEFVKFIAENK